MNISIIFRATIFFLALVGCTAQHVSKDWVEYRSVELGVSFMHPPEYQNAEMKQEVILLQTGSIIVQNTYLRQEQPISPFIIVTRTLDSRILEEAGRYHPLEKRSVNGRSVWFYQIDGMASPEGYIFYDGTAWVSLEFVGLSDKLVIDQILQSVQIGSAVEKK